jgi:hypothetical protein
VVVSDKHIMDSVAMQPRKMLLGNGKWYLLVNSVAIVTLGGVPNKEKLCYYDRVNY